MTTPNLDVASIRKDFPIYETATPDRPLHFLDSAASSQKPRAVLDAMHDLASNHYANVHRGAYRLSLEATHVYEESRRRVAAFIGAAETDVVICRGATTGLNMVAAGWGGEHLRPGNKILLSSMEHHANIVPWQMIAARTGARIDYVPNTPDFLFDMDAYRTMLDGEVKVVAVTGYSNVLGTMPPVTEIARLAHDAGAVVVVDGAQLVPHSPVDVTELGADFMAVSGHKMLGPTGIGFLWGRPERLAEMEPIEGGGEMISDVGLQTSTWAPIPHRFEAGTPPIIEAAGLIAAIDYLESIGMQTVEAHDRMLTDYAFERLSTVEDLVIYGPPTSQRRGGVISFTLADVHPHDLATILDERGVSVRAGHHCAKPLVRSLGVPATARASFHVYNDTDDIDALAEGLSDARALFSI